ncbi:MAG: hypothetical protein L7S64_08475 [Longimicrobiales bacterium]|nr:hypothetical protein [Longimicrobiales bacterium]
MRYTSGSFVWSPALILTTSAFAPLRFLNLPLDRQPIEAFIAQIPPGTCKELEFETEDLEDDEVESGFQAEIVAVHDDIQVQISD